MKKELVFWLFLGGICLVSWLKTPTFDQINQEYQLYSVLDGDTIKVRDQNGQLHHLRLFGIDAPEIGQKSYQGSFDLGLESKKTLTSIMCSAPTIKIVGIGFYKRKIAKIWCHDRYVNDEMVKRGWAHPLSSGFMSALKWSQMKSDLRIRKQGLFSPSLILERPQHYRSMKDSTFFIKQKNINQ